MLILVMDKNLTVKKRKSLSLEDEHCFNSKLCRTKSKT
jgi:hypothetical protein